MGVRSAAAIARRAERRGRTESEQKTADRRDDKQKAAAKVAKEAAEEAKEAAKEAKEASKSADERVGELPANQRAGEPPAGAPVAVGIPLYQLPSSERASLQGITKKDAKSGWLCMGVKGAKCGEINFAYRTKCRKCDAWRLAPVGKPKAPKLASGAAAAPPMVVPNPALAPDMVAKAAAAAAAAGETGTCFKCGQQGHWARHCTAKVVAPAFSKKARALHPKPPSDPSRAWAGTNATGAAERNAELRRRYATDHSSLSNEERERVEALLERDARKAARRQDVKLLKSQLSTTFKRAAGGAGLGRAGAGLVLSSVKGPAPGK